MNFKKIKNPLDKELSLQFKGDVYTIGAKESKSFPGDVSNQWLFIYDFITEVDEKADRVVKEDEEVKSKVTKK